MRKCGGYGYILDWRIDSPIERILAKLADKNEVFKEIYVVYYKLFDRVYYRKGLPMIKASIKQYKEHMGIKVIISEKQLIRDMVYSLHRFGVEFHNYFLFRFYELNTLGREEFIGEKEKYNYYFHLNSKADIALFKDKERSYISFQKYYGREILGVKNISDKALFLDFVLEHHEFIKKPLAGANGALVSKERVNTRQEAENFFEKTIAEGAFVVEEVICQAEPMASLHPESLNTLRVSTILHDNDVHILRPALRMGRNNMVVDNANAGGIFANIDLKTGIVVTEGLTKAGERFVCHPDTGIPIVGFQIPEWDKVLALVKELAFVVTSSRFIGWDLAYSKRGWVMVEGNSQGGIESNLLQSAIRNGAKREVEKICDISDNNTKGRKSCETP